jgi:predicted DNA binding CopG/RHH family protein
MAGKKGKSSSNSKATPASTNLENEGIQSNGTKDSSVTDVSAEKNDVNSNDLKDKDVKEDDFVKDNSAETNSEKDTSISADSTLEPVAAVKGKAKSARTSKKTGKVQDVKEIDNPSAVSEEASKLPTIEEQPAPSKKAAKEQSSEKTGKKKRLTLDISKPLHKAIKAKAVEEGIPMVDMLRSLLEKHYGK